VFFRFNLTQCIVYIFILVMLSILYGQNILKKKAVRVQTATIELLTDSNFIVVLLNKFVYNKKVIHYLYITINIICIGYCFTLDSKRKENMCGLGHLYLIYTDPV